MTRPKNSKRRQCAKCPWKVSTDPNEIPNGYCVTKHKNLSATIAEPGRVPVPGTALRIMACHESSTRASKPCVGWLDNQLGEGNNIALRLAVINGHIDASYELDGEQHKRLEDTLP